MNFAVSACTPFNYMNINVPFPASSAKTPVHNVTPFKTTQRRFGENFDTSTHAAVIQLMMATFGKRPLDLFKTMAAAGDGFDITMKDEFKLHLSREELQRAAQASRFSGADPGAVNVANVVFAAFVKRQQLTGKQPDFAGALARTLTGETVQRCLQGMGVYGLAQRVSAQHLAGKGVAGVMETHTFGAAFVLDGVKHHYDERLRPDRSEGYRLFNDRRDLQPAPVPQKPGTPAVIKPANIWSGFYQGVEGNCVTVSAIKAAMMRFGQHPQGIYRQVTPTPQGFDVVMRDAFRLHVSRDELEQAQGAIGTLANYKHSVVVIDGMLDMYGQKLKLALSDWMRTGARALKLV